VYNGNAVTGIAAIRDLLQRLPATHHVVTSMDCQAIGEASFPVLVISVHGRVEYTAAGLAGPGKSSPAQPFSQQFVLQPEIQGSAVKHHVAQDCFRLV